MKDKCCKCGKNKEVLFYEQKERTTLNICHDCLNKEDVINHAIAHLNGYKAILETKFNIPALAVDDTIKKLKELIK